MAEAQVLARASDAVLFSAEEEAERQRVELEQQALMAQLEGSDAERVHDDSDEHMHTASDNQHHTYDSQHHQQQRHEESEGVSPAPSAPAVKHQPRPPSNGRPSRNGVRNRTRARKRSGLPRSAVLVRDRSPVTAARHHDNDGGNNDDVDDVFSPTPDRRSQSTSIARDAHNDDGGNDDDDGDGVDTDVQASGGGDGEIGGELLSDSMQMPLGEMLALQADGQAVDVRAVSPNPPHNDTTKDGADTARDMKASSVMVSAVTSTHDVLSMSTATTTPVEAVSDASSGHHLRPGDKVLRRAVSVSIGVQTEHSGPISLANGDGGDGDGVKDYDDADGGGDADDGGSVAVAVSTMQFSGREEDGGGGRGDGDADADGDVDDSVQESLEAAAKLSSLQQMRAILKQRRRLFASLIS
ncbi:hypothetical protein PTSG_05680 [Salpingoeca rosetta]|uniref:Uncharacterized protein n=1 Tax=Salpingoeca rosetta (strain ATCC 50818 / BSB-021) TaxID=946362 RepID=F2UBW9_SALR5|nr:uncharacterized protein PTSG_05680 [Salpingoeca rosetta]EGD73985.1 hypothetical protein PTSG_05680 [Salpingoeca rosetta]|eukprot:XP_004993548.1 hypothetical protein PTSG_05680 [Salpingoeca rosetta]